MTATAITVTNTTNVVPSPPKRQSLHTPIPRYPSIVQDSSSFRGSITRFTSRDLLKEDPVKNDILPLECLKQQQYLNSKLSFMVFSSAYLTCVLVFQFVSNSILPNELSWTVTNAVHFLVTSVLIHWEKGSFVLSDEQGELNGMTVWEQLEATPESAVHLRRILQIVPTVLSYTACVTGQFKKSVCLINIAFWFVSMTAKLPFMNGVRLFGFNRTAGIDDIIVDTTKDVDNVGNKKHQ